MRLFLSSFRIGNRPDALLQLLGSGRRTALIANAMDHAEPERREISAAEEHSRLRAVGLEPYEVDLRDYFAGASGLKDELSAVDLLWIRGGNTFILRRALRQSGGDDVIKDLLDDDRIVYGGYSAGVCVLAPSMRGLEFVDKPDVVPDGYDAEVIWEGLDILPYSVAPHYRSDHPESEDMEKTVEYYIDNHIPFIALRDGEAVVVNEGTTEVVS